MGKLTDDINKKIIKESKILFKDKIKYEKKHAKNRTTFDHIKTWKDKVILFDIINLIDENVKIETVKVENIINLLAKIIFENSFDDEHLRKTLNSDKKNGLIQSALNANLKNAEQLKYSKNSWSLSGRAGYSQYLKRIPSLKKEDIKIPKTHIFKDKKIYEIEYKKNKSKKLVEDPIIKPIYNFIKENENGLFISTSPTGSGKSFQITNLIKNEMINNSKQKIIFITDRVENVKSPYETLIKEIDKDPLLNDDDKLYLKSNVTLIDGQENAISTITFDDFNNVFQDIIDLINLKGIKKGYLTENNINNIKDEINIELNKYNLRKDDSKRTSDTKDIRELFENAATEHKDKLISKLKLIVKELKKQKIAEELPHESRNILSYIFSGDAIAEHQVSFLTTTKILYPMAGIVHKTFNFENLQNAIIIIDEFAAQKMILENKFIDVPVYSSNKHLLKIFNIKHMDITNYGIYSCLTEKIKNLKDLLNGDKFEKLNGAKKFTYKKLKEDESERASIFYDGKFGSEITLENKYLNFKSSGSKNLNEILENESNKNNKDLKFIDYLKDLEYFIDNEFSPIIIDMAEELSKELEDCSFDQALIDIFGLLNLEIENNEIFQDGSLFNRVLDNYRTFIQWKNVKDTDNVSGYRNNIRINKFISNGINNDFVDFSTNNIRFNSHVFVLGLCFKNKVIGLSATGLAETNINNFDLHYFNRKLDNGYQTYSNNEIYEIKKSLDYKDNVKDVIYDVDVIDKHIQSDLSEYKEVKDFIFSRDKGTFMNDRFNEMGQAFVKFAKKKHSRYMVSFSSRNMDDYKEITNNYFKNSEYPYVKVFTMLSNDVKNKKIFIDIENHLRNNKKNKVIILTTYQTASSGLNLQRMKLENEKDSYICLNNKYNNDKYDIDTIFLDNPTQVFVEGLYYKPNENKEKKLNTIQLKLILRLKELLANGTLSQSKYKECYKIISRAKSVQDGTLKELSSKIYEGTLDEQENLMAELRQSVGRMLRTNNRCKETNIYISKDFLLATIKHKKISYIDLETKEMKLLIDLMNRYIKSKSILNYEEKIKKAVNLSSSHINILLRYINMPDSSDSYRKEKLLENIKTWEYLREFVLTNGIYFDYEKVRNNDILSECSFDINEQYRFKSNGSLDNTKNFQYTEGNIIDEKYVTLDLVHKNKELKKHFKKKGFITEFNTEFNRALAPNFVNNIYKGAVGEEVFRAVSEMYNLEIEELPINKYEKVDFLFKNTNIGIDIKNWRERHQDEEEKKSFFEKADDKLEHFEKLVYVNIFSDKTELSYTDSDGYIVPKKDAKIVFLKGIFSKETGLKIDNVDKLILELKEWINK